MNQTRPPAHIRDELESVRARKASLAQLGSMPGAIPAMVRLLEGERDDCIAPMRITVGLDEESARTRTRLAFAIYSLDTTICMLLDCDAYASVLGARESALMRELEAAQAERGRSPAADTGGLQR